MCAQTLANGAILCDNCAMDERNLKIYNLLDEAHKDAKCELEYSTPFELLIAVVLSAQCTDRRVNQVTRSLFQVADTPQQFANMPLSELEQRIYSCGFYHNKAVAIKELSNEIINAGGMPTTFDGLIKLRGVGRKTANVICSEAYKMPAIAVDTHVFRVANRLGLADAKTPEQTEIALKSEFDEDKWSHLHHLLIFQGRYVCKSQRPECDKCNLRAYCKYYDKVARSTEKI